LGVTGSCLRRDPARFRRTLALALHVWVVATPSHGSAVSARQSALSSLYGTAEDRRMRLSGYSTGGAW
jgi:hypothetical protein